MKMIHSFLKLDNEIKWLLIKALIFLWVIRIMLWIFSFNKIQKILKRWSKSQSTGTIPLSRITWGINVMSRFAPQSTCLVKALAGWLLLSEYGFDSEIKIGVSRREEFEAHAWLEHENEVILGASEVNYIPILGWNKNSEE